jgi:hypothetical protein
MQRKVVKPMGAEFYRIIARSIPGGQVMVFNQVLTRQEIENMVVLTAPPTVSHDYLQLVAKQFVPQIERATGKKALILAGGWEIYGAEMVNCRECSLFPCLASEEAGTEPDEKAYERVPCGGVHFVRNTNEVKH